VAGVAALEMESTRIRKVATFSREEEMASGKERRKRKAEKKSGKGRRYA
jgi:hypothetical protein